MFELKSGEVIGMSCRQCCILIALFVVPTHISALKRWRDSGPQSVLRCAARPVMVVNARMGLDDAPHDPGRPCPRRPKRSEATGMPRALGQQAGGKCDCDVRRCESKKLGAGRCRRRCETSINNRFREYPCRDTPSRDSNRNRRYPNSAYSSQVVLTWKQHQARSKLSQSRVDRLARAYR